MSEKIRLIWLAVEFTPYHEHFFETLAADGRFDLKVIIMMGSTKSHPFDNDRPRPYEWEMANPKVRIDFMLLSRILAEHHAWFVVSSYLRPTLMAAMKILAMQHRPFIYFTDTPLPQDMVWNDRLPKKRSWPRRLARGMRLRWIFAHAFRVLATGVNGVEAVNKLGCPPEKSLVFPYWVDLPPIASLRPLDQTIRLLGVGQLIYRKGWDLAILALQQVQQKRPDLQVSLWLIGDGPDRSLLEGMVDALDLKSSVIFLGWRQPSEIATLFGQVDALIHPARWDPFGVVILEAMSHGLPILGSDKTGAVVDRVIEGISGWIHPVNDLAKLVLDVIAMVENQERRLQMGIQARAKAMEWPASRGVETLFAIMNHKNRHVSNKIRLFLVSAVIDPQLGGPAAVLQRQIHALQAAGVEVTLFGVAEQHRLPLMGELYPNARLFPATAPRRWYRGAGLFLALTEAISRCDVVHAHMLWDHTTWAAWRITQWAGKPLIITPHGSLMEPWRYRSWHKRLYRQLLLDPMLQQTTFMHVLSSQEMLACEQAGVKTPLRIIPNGLESTDFVSPLGLQADPVAREHVTRLIDRQWPVLLDHHVLLFLGRLWEGKGVIDLVEAWATLLGQPMANSWILVLAGPDYQGGRQRLEERIKQLGIAKRVLLTGPVFGGDKTALLTLAAGFVLPSRSEGASMAVLEAMAAGIPIVLTQECHFPVLAEVGGGIEVPMGVEGIAEGLTRLLSMDPSARVMMGQKGHALAKSRFTMSHIASEWMALYQEAIALGGR